MATDERAPMTLPELPFGSWPSPLSPATLAAASLRLGETATDSDCVYWWEGRPSEGGRGVVVTVGDDRIQRDVTPPGSNVRTTVHEYGGAAWTVSRGDTYYVDYADQQIHVVTTDGSRSITDEAGSRFADLTPHPDGRHLLAVREHHGADSGPDGSETVVNDLVAIDITTGSVRRLFAGTDFVSSPRPSPDGDQVAFITWSHPNMPWDHTELRTVPWDDATAGSRTLVSGEAIQQPTWSRGRLIVVTDRTGWWLPHEVDIDTGAVTSLVHAEVDMALPPWVFGSRTTADVDGELAVMWQADGFDHVGWLRDGRLVELDIPEIDINSIAVTTNGTIVAAAASAREPSRVVLIARDGSVESLHQHDAILTPDAISVAEHISFESAEGRTAHALLYRPSSAMATGPADQLPPLLVLSHGGPTSSARGGFSSTIQFWTTRGFAVADVNYGGSTGYGRDYRELLRDSWGIVDVQDCIAAAEHLTATGVVDATMLAIKGGSAGGYTTLAALAFHDVFSAGASRYGIGDLETLARDTHKFESRYLDGLIGPYPEASDVYVARSPIHAIDRITAPMIVLQGSEDKVVPPNQAEDIVRALADSGLPHAYVLFEGEQHGFRDAANIARAVEAEYVFFCRIFGIEPSGDPTPLEIVGLD